MIILNRILSQEEPSLIFIRLTKIMRKRNGMTAFLRYHALEFMGEPTWGCMLGY